MNGDTRATLGMIFQCIISLPDKWSSLLLPMVSAVFKPIILPVKMKNSLIHCFCKEVGIWVNLICLLSITVQSVADVGWCAVFYLWAAAYCKLFLPLLAWESRKHEWYSLYCLGDVRTILAWRSMGQLQIPVKTILTENWKGLWKAFEEKWNSRYASLCSDSCCPCEN